MRRRAALEQGRKKTRRSRKKGGRAGSPRVGQEEEDNDVITPTTWQQGILPSVCSPVRGGNQRGVAASGAGGGGRKKGIPLVKSVKWYKKGGGEDGVSVPPPRQFSSCPALGEKMNSESIVQRIYYKYMLHRRKISALLELSFLTSYHDAAGFSEECPGL